MSPDEFRAAGHATIEWIARYLETIEDRPVLSGVAPGDLRRQLPPSPPEDPEAFDAILADLDRLVLPGITHWQHPSFFGYFPANASPPAILGELVSAGLGVQGMLWATSPAATELETHVLDWLVVALGLPERFASTGSGGSVIQDSASSATLCALLAARGSLRWGCGPALPDAVRQPRGPLLDPQGGPHRGVLRRPAAVDRHRRRPRHAPRSARPGDRRRSAGREESRAGPVPPWAPPPTTALDPVADIAPVCADAGVWLHVDAAYAGSAAVCPELRFVNAGLEGADSYCFNPHKWLLTNFDCTAMYVADRAPLISALSVLPEYLRNQPTEAGQVIDYRDWHVPLGRRFRALKLWFVLAQLWPDGAAGPRPRPRGVGGGPGRPGSTPTPTSIGWRRPPWGWCASGIGVGMR